MFDYERFSAQVKDRFPVPSSLDEPWAERDPQLAKELLHKRPEDLSSRELGMITEAYFPQWGYLLPEIMKRAQKYQPATQLPFYCELMMWEWSHLTPFLQETGSMIAYTEIILDCFRKLLESVTIAKAREDQAPFDHDEVIPFILREGTSRDSLLACAYKENIWVCQPDFGNEMIQAFFSERQGADIHLLDFAFTFALIESGRDAIASKSHWAEIMACPELVALAKVDLRPHWMRVESVIREIFPPYYVQELEKVVQKSNKA